MSNYDRSVFEILTIKEENIVLFFNHFKRYNHIVNLFTPKYKT